jgi:hypothetical protein
MITFRFAVSVLDLRVSQAQPNLGTHPDIPSQLRGYPEYSVQRKLAMPNFRKNFRKA